MTEAQQAPISPVNVAADLTMADLRHALAEGWRDFLTHPLYGLFFGAIYVAGGLALAWALTSRGASGWLFTAAAGFPLVAPFTAVGLYEVSRRREAGLPLSWGTVLGALRGRGDDQLLMMGGFIFVGFTFWMILAHGIFAIFMAESGVGSESLEVFRTTAGIAMLVVGTAVGAVIAYVFYAVTVISLPMLVDRDVDFLTAIIKSLRTVQANGAVMLGWAVVIAAALFAAMIPAFAGLLVILPVLGHATWHLYRRVVSG
ncbi:MAG: DUF2189 domain-containing protein [Sphingomonadales bacterium]|nr:DUF2189 domain-containing protein [Sphingomonadales bacterium]